MVMRDQARLAVVSADLRPGDRTFYDPVTDLLVGNGGAFFTNDADLAWQGESLLLGLRWSSATALYDARHAAPGEPVAPSLTLQRLGPVAAWSWRDEGSGHETTLLATVSPWLVHPYRATLTQPLGFVAVSTSGEFWRSASE